MAGWQEAIVVEPLLGRHVPALSVAPHLALRDIAALAAVGSSVAAAFRSACFPVASCCREGGSGHNNEFMDLVCCALAVTVCCGEVNLGNMCLPDGKTVLTRAAAAGRPDVVRWLLEALDSRGMVNHPDAHGATSLHYAALHGHHHVCQVLLDWGANANAADMTGLRPLHLAADGGHHAACRSLLERRAEPNALDEENVGPLLQAVEQRHADVSRLLVLFRADPLLCSLDGKSAMAIARDTGPDLLNVLESALWPQVRKKVPGMKHGPEAMEMISRTIRAR